MRRSRQELSNEHLLAKIGVDTAEKEHLKVHLIIKPWDLIFTEPPRPLLSPQRESQRLLTSTFSGASELALSLMF